MSEKSLRSYQIKGVKRLLEITGRRNAALLADEPGLGKTIQVAEFINQARPHRALVVCPASLRVNWRNELSVWLRYIPETLAVVSYEALVSGKFKNEQFDLAVFDEAHYLKNPSAKRTKACLKLNAATRLFLTGTPVVNRPIDIFPILQSCGMKLTKTEFGKRYCDGKLVVIRWRPKKYAWDFSGASNVEELNASLRKHLMVRRTKREVLTELPKKIRQVVELADRTLPENGALVKAMFSGFTSAAAHVSSSESITFDELSAARLELARAKLPDVIAFASDLLEEEPKLVIFAHHREIIEALAGHFGECAVRLYGGMTDRQKNAAVEAFQHGDKKVFVGQISAAGTGLTLTAAKTVLFAELDWVPGNIIQCEDRCHRFGQTEPVRIFHLTAAGSTDAKMIHALVDKQKIIEAVTA